MLHSRKIKPSKKIAFAGVILASAVALGFALAPIPNIELVSLTIAIGGFILGPIWGAVCGGLAWAVYSATSPFGMAPLPLYLSQILGGITIGLLGGLLHFAFRKFKNNIARIIISATIGMFATAVYQVFVNVGSFISFGSEDTILIYIITGISFVLLQILSNTIIFGILIPAINRILLER